ncbi:MULTISPECIES: hypothetical protein [Roseateles]|uniref:Stereocilin n=1 Tax=Pelomonas aquatica TaxID=431058 RepID=A0ABU1ZCR8_9BURK|nr:MULTISPECIES: hypothetical protein [Roseateles]MDR7297826.1 hypothetical protein [Pelomonas aquatica]
MNATQIPPPASVPGSHPDDDSVAGEEDPGASLDDQPESTPVPGTPQAPVPPVPR